MSSAVREKVEEYFASLNPISKRMMADMSYAKQQYGEKWHSLSLEEKEEALWRCLVKAEVEDQFQKLSEKSDIECFPVLRLKSGGRIVVDEDASTGKPFGSSWRDEHSSPFCWETQSQLNLMLCGRDKKKDDVSAQETAAVSQPVVSTQPVGAALPVLTPQPAGGTVQPAVETPKEERKAGEMKHQTIKRPEVPPPPVPPHATPPGHEETTPPVPPHAESSDAPIYAKVVKRKSSAKTLVISEMKAHKKALQEMKPAVPPRMSLELKIDINPESGDSGEGMEAIPKTGFDFLDNW